MHFHQAIWDGNLTYISPILQRLYNLARWPSGLRRQFQVLVFGRGFESRSCHIPFFRSVFIACAVFFFTMNYNGFVEIVEEEDVNGQTISRNVVDVAEQLKQFSEMSLKLAEAEQTEIVSPQQEATCKRVRAALSELAAQSFGEDNNNQPGVRKFTSYPLAHHVDAFLAYASGR